jgi:hypothetical protein
MVSPGELTRAEMTMLWVYYRNRHYGLGLGTAGKASALSDFFAKDELKKLAEDRLALSDVERWRAQGGLESKGLVEKHQPGYRITDEGISLCQAMAAARAPF